MWFRTGLTTVLHFRLAQNSPKVFRFFSLNLFNTNHDVLGPGRSGPIHSTTQESRMANESIYEQPARVLGSSCACAGSEMRHSEISLTLQKDERGGDSCSILSVLAGHQ